MAVSRDHMGVSRYFSAVDAMLEGSGVRLNGPNPWDIEVNDDEFLRRTLAQGSLGVGEAYMDGQWDCKRLDDMLTRVFRADADRRLPDAGQLWAALLAPDGLFLLHTIGRNVSGNTNDPWIEKYIFPNSLLPSMAQIGAAAEGSFVVEDWHAFGPDYDRTLLCRYERIRAA